jgi:integrase
VVRAKIKGVFCTYKTLSDGTRRRYWYHRATGHPLSGLPGSLEFIADLARAEEFMKSRLNGDNFNGLIRDYTLSIEFEQRLAASTQAEYRRMLTKAEARFGSMPVAEVLDDPRIIRHFLKWREDVARVSGQREADNRLSAVSAMLTWGKEHGRITVNHLKGFRRLYHADRSEKIWLPEHIEAFMKAAPIELQRALIIALHTGQRQADILKLVWTAYNGQSLILRQGKSRRRVQAPPITIPCTKPLRAVLDAIPRTSALILATKTGQPFKKRYFSQLWDRSTKAAGLTDLHFHDIRGTAITMLSEAGCTAQQIAPITGHSIKTITVIIDRYLARTRGLADQAIFNFENSPRTEFANRIANRVASTKAAKGNTDE